jgi:hypothetical protein
MTDSVGGGQSRCLAQSANHNNVGSTNGGSQQGGCSAKAP